MEALRHCAAIWRIPHGRAGLLLIAICWPLNWGLPDATLRSSFLFFPLWLGYALTIDALVVTRGGWSILTRSRHDFVGLFFASAPAWWLFEWINQRTRNWEYLGGTAFNEWEYVLLSTLAFSTVMPAVFESAELARTFHWTKRFADGPRLTPTRALTTGLFVAGAVMLVLTLLWPRYCYPLVWGAVVLMVEPVNLALGRPSLLARLKHGDWQPVVALSTGALLCGLFWEMWNYFAYPKWIYHTPGAEVWYVFEMPLPGYLGYLPFAWELFALRSFLLPRAGPLRL